MEIPSFLLLFLIFSFFLSWGSFLNLVAYRLVHTTENPSRSFCPHCTTTLAWYDLIPLISWVMLQGKCRTCKQAISFLYPFIELLTASIFTLLLFLIPPAYWLYYSIFFSALIITIRTDLETMLISRYVTLFLLPIPFLFSLTATAQQPWGPLSPWDCLLGMLFGYALLWSIAKLFFLFTRRQGVGEGDFELLAFVGGFTGITGCWFALMLGSLLGSCIGLIVSCYKRQFYNIKIPFGPFIAIGAIIYTLFEFHTPLLLLF